MTVVITPPAVPDTDETLDALLSPTHDAWIEEARQLLLPANESDPEKWDRWAAIRYLNEGLVERLRAERALVRELRPFLTTREVVILESGGERACALALALDRIARRRSTTTEFAAVAGEFLAAVSLWCAEIELAGRYLRFGALPDEMQRKLEQLGAGQRTRCWI